MLPPVLRQHSFGAYIMAPRKHSSPIALFIVVAVAAGVAQAVSLHYPSTPAIDDLLNAASVAESNNDMRSARETYELAAKHYPSSAKSWAAYGEHLRFYVHDDVAAGEAFRKAIEAKETDRHALAFAWRGLGEIEIKKGNGDKAIENFRKSLQAMPLSDTHRSLCHLYVTRRDWKNSAEQARLAVETDRDDPIAILLYAAQLQRAGQSAFAHAQFERAMALAGIDAEGNPSRPVHCCVWYNGAGYQAVSGNVAGALKMLHAFFETPNHRHLTRNQVEEDPDFADLKNLPEFIQMLDQYLS
jgi:Tfp pilus assembly protein PilF